MKHFFTNKVKAALIIAVLLAAALAVIGNLTGKTLPETEFKRTDPNLVRAVKDALK